MRFSALSAACCLLAACQSSHPDAERNPTLEPSTEAALPPTEPAPASAETAAAIRRVRPALTGAWVQASYLDALARSRSPYAERNTFREVAAMTIAAGPRAADSLTIGASLGNHEGGEFAAYLRPGRHAQSLPTSLPNYEQPGHYYELRYQTLGADTSLHLDHYDQRHRRLETTAYRRVRLPRPDADDLGAGLQYAVNELLLAGRYAGQDSAGRPLTVRFAADGTVSGLGRARQYSVATDFAAGPENNLDVLTFDGYSARPRTFAYRLAHDTLRLYALRPAANHLDLRPARLHYTLVRR